MVGRLTIGMRIGLGFTFVLVFLAAGAAISTWGLDKVVCYAKDDLSANKLKTELTQREVDHLIWVSKVSALFTDKDIKELTVETDHQKCGLGKWLYGEGRQTAEQLIPSIAPLCKEIEAHHAKLHQSAVNIKSDWALHSAEGEQKAKTAFLTETKPTLAGVQELLGKMRDSVTEYVATADATMQKSATSTQWYVLLGAITTLFLGAGCAFFIGRGVCRILKQIIAGLRDGAEQVDAAARQVASASQQLAEGATEQASSLEETSSALEQMSAMTHTNASNAQQANDLSTKARAAASAGDQTMAQLNEAMTAINESSEKISKIIKVIEEIAFQTNLLALNAAVEAARAGEHGKGFAVVADEVRNLSQRAAQAAKETATLIEGAVTNVHKGTDVATAVGKSLDVIGGEVAQISTLIDGISRASDEQARGVDQINTAVSQMDKVTQQTAAGAEQSAAASEQLSAQAASVKSLVDDLVVLVEGDQGDRRGVSHAAAHDNRKSLVAKNPSTQRLAGQSPDSERFT